MGRTQKCKYLKKRENHIISWLNGSSQLAIQPGSAQNDDNAQFLIDKYGLEDGIPYSEDRNGLWNLKNELKRLPTQQDDDQLTVKPVPLAVVEMDPDFKGTARVFFNDSVKIQDLKVANFKSVITEKAKEQRAATKPSIGKAADSGGAQARNSSRKTVWHKKHRCPTQLKPTEDLVEGKDILTGPGVVCLFSARDSKFVKKSPLTCESKVELKRHQRDWLNYLVNEEDYYSYGDDEELGSCCVDASAQDDGHSILDSPIELSLDQLIKSSVKRGVKTGGTSLEFEPDLCDYVRASRLDFIEEEVDLGDEAGDDDWIMVDGYLLVEA